MNKTTSFAQHEASFRDPSGFMFELNGKLYRQINKDYKRDYDHLLESGLYNELISKGLLIKHKDVSNKINFVTKDGYKVIEPDLVKFISYPYEWSFSQYKDAALTTLELQRRALEKGMILKDASAYNIQFLDGVPILIDTLSFEKYTGNEPWIAYKQFCQHFLAPLVLMSETDIDLSKLMKIYIDGVPLMLASKLLKGRSKRKLGIFTHIKMHARSQSKHADDGRAKKAKQVYMSKNAMMGLITSLASTVKAIKWEPKGTEWGAYYSFTNYSKSAFNTKQKIINKYINKVKPRTVWDVGANNGLFSRIASDAGVPTVAFDIDPIAVEANYRRVKESNEKNMLPIVMDLTNPSPSIGWANNERESFTKRGPVDMIFSLALIHHLSISNNLPLSKSADYFSSLCNYLVIEFVPKGDSQVNILLATRKDIFPDYNESGFEKAFSKKFNVISKDKVGASKRTLYLMKRK